MGNLKSVCCDETQHKLSHTIHHEPQIQVRKSKSSNDADNYHRLNMDHAQDVRKQNSRKNLHVNDDIKSSTTRSRLSNVSIGFAMHSHNFPAFNNNIKVSVNEKRVPRRHRRHHKRKPKDDIFDIDPFAHY